MMPQNWLLWSLKHTAAKKAWNPLGNFSNISHKQKLDLTKQQKNRPEKTFENALEAKRRMWSFRRKKNKFI